MDKVKNPANILGKPWGYQQIWKLLQPLLAFLESDTKEIDTIDLLNYHTMLQPLDNRGVTNFPPNEHHCLTIPKPINNSFDGLLVMFLFAARIK